MSWVRVPAFPNIKSYLPPKIFSGTASKDNRQRLNNVNRKHLVLANSKAKITYKNEEAHSTVNNIVHASRPATPDSIHGITPSFFFKENFDVSVIQ